MIIRVVIAGASIIVILLLVSVLGATTDDSTVITNNLTLVNSTTIPVITLNGTNPQTIEWKNGYTELGATTDDGSTVTINSLDFVNSVGIYLIYYDSSNTYGNATQVIRTVNVIDTTSPIITLTENNLQITNTTQTVDLENNDIDLENNDIDLNVIPPYIFTDKPKSNQELLAEIMCLKKIEGGINSTNCDILKLSNETLQFTEDSDTIGIILSTTCKRTIMVQSDDSCPTYDLLREIYPNIIVDPDYKLIPKIKIIMIEPNLPAYKNNLSEQTSYNNQTNSFEFNFSEKRFVNPNCRYIIIESDWNTLNDTIQFLMNNCDDNYTSIDTSLTWSKNATEINLLDFAEYRYQIWLKDIIKNCVHEYGKCK